MKNENFEYSEYINSIHRYGRIGLTIALLMLLAAPFAFSLITDAEIQWNGFLKASIAVLIIYIPSSVVEYLIYVPLLGPGASYLAFITGNITNLKLPCAFNARDIAKAEVGTKENEIISTLSVATSSLVTMVVIFIGVLLLIPLTPLLNNPVIKPAFDNVLPALFGALGMQYYIKSLKLSVLPLLLMSVLCILIPSLIAQTSTMIIVIGAFSIALSYLMYRKNWL